MKEIYPGNIGIGGDRANEDQYWRILRIHRILGYAQALADQEDNSDYYKKIKSIYDLKGTLYVSWNVKPTEKEKEYLRKAWESIVTDYEANPIEHEIV